MINEEISIGLATFLIIIAGFIFKKTSDHADKKHAESEMVRNTYRKNDAVEVWVEKNTKNTQHFIILLDDGRFADWIVLVFDDGTIVEKSVFIPKNGEYSKLEKWLKNKAIRIR